MGTAGSDLLLCGAISSVNGENGTFTHIVYQLLGIMLGDLYMETHLDPADEASTCISEGLK